LEFQLEQSVAEQEIVHEQVKHVSILQEQFLLQLNGTDPTKSGTSSLCFITFIFSATTVPIKTV
jgi:hypothetical protein